MGRMDVPHLWYQMIDGWLRVERAGGAPATTLRARREHLQHAARRLPPDPLQVTPAQLLDYFAGQSWAVETRRGRRTTLQRFYGWLVDAGRLDASPAAALPRVRATVPQARPAPDRIYLEALLRADARDALWLRLAAEAGLRRAEIAGIHGRDLHPDLAGMSLLVRGKGGKRRLVPLPARLGRDLADWVERDPRGFAFPGGRHGHVSPEYLGKRIARLLDGHWTVHTLRHRFAARAYQVDHDVLAVQELLGHQSPATTRRYIPLASADHLRHTVTTAAG